MTKKSKKSAIGSGLNAQYDRKSVSFLQWTIGNRTIQTGASADAVAHDVTPAGFGFESRVRLDHVGWVYFELRLPNRQSVSGSARVAWLRRGEWGAWAGAHIVAMSAADRRKVRDVIHGPGYDWAGLANRAVAAGVIIILAVAARMALSRDSDAWIGFPFLVLAACAAAIVYARTR